MTYLAGVLYMWIDAEFQNNANDIAEAVAVSEQEEQTTYTQEELSKRFGISMTMMKKCFYSMYGTTMGAWLTSYRMNQAAVLLKSGQSLNVAEIAGRVGYDSPSKFAAAFRKVMKKSPTEYRNSRIPEGGLQ